MSITNESVQTEVTPTPPFKLSFDEGELIADFGNNRPFTARGESAIRLFPVFKILQENPDTSIGDIGVIMAQSTPLGWLNMHLESKPLGLTEISDGVFRQLQPAGKKMWLDVRLKSLFHRKEVPIASLFLDRPVTTKDPIIDRVEIFSANDEISQILVRAFSNTKDNPNLTDDLKEQIVEVDRTTATRPRYQGDPDYGPVDEKEVQRIRNRNTRARVNTALQNLGAQFLDLAY